MKSDPTTMRVRKARSYISEKYGHNTENLVKHYQDKEKNTNRKIFKKSEGNGKED